MAVSVIYSAWALSQLDWPEGWTGSGSIDGLPVRFFDKPIGGTRLPIVIASESGCFFNFQDPTNRPGAVVTFSALAVELLDWPGGWSGQAEMDSLPLSYLDKPTGGARLPLRFATDSGCFFRFQIPPVPRPPAPILNRKQCILVEGTHKVVDLRLTTEPWEGPQS